jgi:hypothetical protein
MRLHLLALASLAPLSLSLSLCAALVTLPGCSSSPSSVGAGAGDGPGGGLPGSGNDGGLADGGQPSSSAAGWRPIALDPAYGTSKVAARGDAVWIDRTMLADAADHSRTVLIGPIDGEGTFHVRSTNVQPSIVLLNYLVMGLAPVDATTAVIARENGLIEVGSGADDFLSTTTYFTSSYVRAPNDIWAGTRIGSLVHYDGASTTISSLPDEVTTRALWQSKSTLYFATEEQGLRSIALPIPAVWNGDTQRAVPGSTLALAGSADDDAFVVGKGGLVAHFDGATWTPQAIDTTSDLVSVATVAKNDAWASSKDALFHHDGAGWSTVTEPGMPAGATALAVASDGTLWVASGGNVFRRGPGKVTGKPTTTKLPPPPTDVCSVGEPNDMPDDAVEVSPSFTAVGCSVNSDTDYYEFVTPIAHADGYAAITITDQANGHPSLGVDFPLPFTPPTLALYDAPTKSMFLPVPGASRQRIEVVSTATSGTGQYTVSSTFVAFDDPFEPNDREDDAISITPGVAIQSLLPTGVRRSTAFDAGEEAYDNIDYFKASVAAGPFTVTISNLPAGSQIRLRAGGQVANGAPGAPVTISGTNASATSVLVEIEDTTETLRAFVSATPPPAFTQKYTLLVSN